MPDHPAFLRTIAASHDDDAPRLVYADYLEEQGRDVDLARAEFIRIDIDWSRKAIENQTSIWPWWQDPDWIEWAQLWRSELPEFPRLTYGGFVRGFVDTIMCGGMTIAELVVVAEAIPLRHAYGISEAQRLELNKLGFNVIAQANGYSEPTRLTTRQRPGLFIPPD